MADTRTIYLHTITNTFSSDPSDTEFDYLDMSDYDSLNPEYNKTVRVANGVIGMYEDYTTKITLTFKGSLSGKMERSDWINKYSHDINSISVAPTSNKDRLFNKRCAVSSIEMIDTPYIDGAQVQITLTLFGRWQSALEQRETVTENYNGGTKKYYRENKTIDVTSSALVGSAYVGKSLVGDGTIPNQTTRPTNKYKYNYKYGTLTLKNQLSLPEDKNRFILSLDPNYVTGRITLSNSQYTVTITSDNLEITNGLSSDFITYNTGDFDLVTRFTLLQKGYVASTVWDNVADKYAVLYSIMNTINNDPANINVSNSAGQHIPFKLFVYSIQDFI